MFCYIVDTVYSSLAEKYYLIEWVCDGGVSTVEEKSIRSSGEIECSSTYPVKYGHKYLEGTVLAIGKCSNLEQQYAHTCHV